MAGKFKKLFSAPVLLTIASGCFIAACVTGLTIYWFVVPKLPPIESLRDVQLQVPLKIYTKDEMLIAEYGEKRRAPLEIENTPKTLINAVLAAEDDRFYEHYGVDPKGLLRAVVYLIRTGHKGPGGSTITMQVARNFFLSRERTYLRKLNEILLSFKIERELSKNEILELYLNKIYLGNRSYGFAAAAQVYYGKKLDEMTPAQIA
ncbi:MAG: transglycosylase domain-containing protein, partial [Gammaproteobacteria bacterium]